MCIVPGTNASGRVKHRISLTRIIWVSAEQATLRTQPNPVSAEPVTAHTQPTLMSVERTSPCTPHEQ